MSILEATIADAGVDPRRLAGLYLTGGSSRIPAIATAIHARLRITPSTHADPKAVTPQGALTLTQPAPPPPPTAQPPATGGLSTAPEVQISNRWLAYGKGGFKSGRMVLTTRRISFTLKISQRVEFDVPLDAIREVGSWSTGVSLVLADGSRHRSTPAFSGKRRCGPRSSAPATRICPRGPDDKSEDDLGLRSLNAPLSMSDPPVRGPGTPAPHPVGGWRNGVTLTVPA